MEVLKIRKELSGVLICFCLIVCLGNYVNSYSQTNNANFQQLVKTWNNAHNLKEVDIISNLYENSVLFYGRQQDKKTCIAGKLSLFNKTPNFQQQIFGEIQVDKINETETKCTFVKRVTVNQKIKDYPSYLIFKKSTVGWKIETEGDMVTDMNLSKMVSNKTSDVPLWNYEYEPSVSIISGIIKIKRYYGPPGFGEDPQTDSKEDSYILNLDQVINLISKAKEMEGEDYNTTKYHIVKVQLTASSNIHLSDFKNKAVRLTGTFFGAFTGHHHTEVLLNVQKIEYLQK